MTKESVYFKHPVVFCVTFKKKSLKERKENFRKYENKEKKIPLQPKVCFASETSAEWGIRKEKNMYFLK